jgi:hypothetical protein
MTRPIVISLVFMVILTIASAVYLLDVTQMVQSIAEIDEEETSFEDLDEPLFEATDPPIEIRMFFPASNNDVLIRTRTMTIFESEKIENQARQIIDLLITGPGNSNLFAQLPPGTRLNEIIISEDGIAYIDFSGALSDNHPGGVLPEQATVYSIVNSLAYNLDGIDQVKILIGGVEKETLAGHCLLLLPLETDLSITDIAFQGAEPTEAAGQTR